MSTNYSGALRRDGRDLVDGAVEGTLPPIFFREPLVERVLDRLDHGHSVLLTGAEGVGKSAVVHAVAHAMAERNRGGLRELSTAVLMTGTVYLGEYQTKIGKILEEARHEDAVLYIADLWNLASVGKTAQDQSCLLDAFRPALDAGKAVLLGEAAPEFLRQMQRVPGFVRLFQQIAVSPLEASQVDGVLERVATHQGLTLAEPCRRALVQLTSRFMPVKYQPGPALSLWRQTLDYQSQKEGVGEPEPISVGFIEKVFSIYSGLPRFVVSQETTMAVQEMRAWFKERIVGQERAIEAVVEAIALFKAGLHDPSRPIGSFLFVGPTGVGKTELARALATFIFGSASRLLRFDLSEFKDYHSFELLVGKPSDAQRPARLVDPVRAQPFQVVLFDELEKAHQNVWDLFLQLLDEGRLTPDRGGVVNFCNTFVIATSNVGADTALKGVGFGGPPDPDAHAAAVRKALEKAFRPEFINRFQHIVVFHPLTREQVRCIARHHLREILGRDGITARNLVVDVDDAAMDRAIGKGYDPRYGARALKREIQRQLVLPLATTLVEKRVEEGSILRVHLKSGQIHVRVVDTPTSRASRREQEPVRTVEGRRQTRADLVKGVAQVGRDIEAIAAAVDEPFLETDRSRLLELRREPDFWSHPEEVARTLRDLDRYTAWLDRIDALRGRATAITEELGRAELRRETEQLANRLEQLQISAGITHRELVILGKPGDRDTLVEIRPLGRHGRAMRDLLVSTYTRWAEQRQLAVDWIREPVEDDEPALFAINGHCAHGFMALETGIHRQRDDEVTSAAAVRVVPWTEERRPPRFDGHRALKIRGQFGGKIRSRVECEGELVLQNARTLAENRDLAAQIAPSWAAAGAVADEIIRRYDVEPFRIRDVLTGESIGRSDGLKPRLFHQLLVRRIDANG